MKPRSPAVWLSTLLCTVIVMGCSVSAKPNHIPVTTLYPVMPGSIKTEGTALSRQEAEIHAPRDGIVLLVSADLGDRVKEGQTLAVLQPDRSQGQLMADLLFKQRELEIVKDQLARETSHVGENVQSHADYWKKEYEMEQQDNYALLKKTDVEIKGARTERDLTLSHVANAMYDFVDATTEMMYTDSDALKSYHTNSSFDHFRRREIFYQHELVSLAFEKKLLAFYTALTETHSTKGLQALLEQAVELGMEARSLAGGFSPSADVPFARVADIQKRLGDAVEDLLTYSANLELSESKLQILEAEKERIAVKISQPFTAPPLDKKFLERSPELIEAEIMHIRQQIGKDRVVSAPFDGVISKRHANVGDSVGLSSTLFTLINDQNKFIRFSVAQEAFQYVKQGQEVSFSPKYDEPSVYKAIIKRVSHSIDPETGTIEVEADLKIGESAELILSHMPAVVSVPVPENLNLFEVPLKALHVSDRPNTIWTVDKKGRAEPRIVKVKFTQGDFAYVESGLTSEDQIVVESPIHLEPSLVVAVKSK